MLLWAAAGAPLGVYNIVEEFNVALRIQPQVLTALKPCYLGPVSLLRESRLRSPPGLIVHMILTAK